MLKQWPIRKGLGDNKRRVVIGWRCNSDLKLYILILHLQPMTCGDQTLCCVYGAKTPWNAAAAPGSYSFRSRWDFLRVLVAAPPLTPKMKRFVVNRQSAGLVLLKEVFSVAWHDSVAERFSQHGIQYKAPRITKDERHFLKLWGASASRVPPDREWGLWV